MFKKDEIIILLGAGASFDAKIPTSQGMITKIEELLEKEWQKYRDLYHFLKTSIRYLDGIRGRLESTSFNIEQLVNTLDELRRGDAGPARTLGKMGWRDKDTCGRIFRVTSLPLHERILHADDRGPERC